MKFEEYRKINLRTNKWLGSQQLDLAHALIGMTSELNELHDAIASNDLINVSEELADIAWYLSLYLQVRNLHAPKIPDDIDYFPLANLTRSISLLNDLAKKWIIYNKDFDIEKEDNVLAAILYSLSKASVNGVIINLERGLQNNIDKLKKRYPDAYSDELAQNRNLEAERKELEK